MAESCEGLSVSDASTFGSGVSWGKEDLQWPPAMVNVALRLAWEWFGMEFEALVQGEIVWKC
jgi:hypothetical protein